MFSCASVMNPMLTAILPNLSLIWPALFFLLVDDGVGLIHGHELVRDEPGGKLHFFLTHIRIIGSMPAFFDPLLALW